MRVFFILDETVFYHPRMLEKILKNSRHQFVGIAISIKDVLMRYFIQHLLDIGIVSAFKLGAEKYIRKFYSKILTPFTQKPMTVKDVALKYKLPHFIVTRNINDQDYLERIRSFNPDVIVSSNSQIFYEELLEIPRIGCINRHSSLLPGYGGILPVFQAVIHQEKEVGVSIHYMDRGIDQGKVITQQAVPIGPNETLAQIYRKCFDLSAELIVEALDIIERELPPKVLGSISASYYSFPSDDHWRQFKKCGRRFT